MSVTPLDLFSLFPYNNTVRVHTNLLLSSRLMLYTIYDDSEVLRGTFNSIYDMERYIDGVRNTRGEAYPETPRMSPFDYIKSIGWSWDCVDNYMESKV